MFFETLDLEEKTLDLVFEVNFFFTILSLIEFFVTLGLLYIRHGSLMELI